MSEEGASRSNQDDSSSSSSFHKKKRQKKSSTEGGGSPTSSQSLTKQRTIQIQIPEGAEHGDSLTFAVNGKELEITIPHGSQPGDVLQLQVNETSSNTEKDSEPPGGGGVSSADDNDLSSTVALHSTTDASLRIYHKIPEDTSNQDTNPSTDNDDKDDDNVDGTYGMVWPCGRYLAKFVTDPKVHHLWKDTTSVVELGSGLGVGGLAVATSISKTKGSSPKVDEKLNILLTDLAPALPILQYNIEANKNLISSDLNVKAEVYSWAVPEKGTNENSTSMREMDFIDWIIASDVLYNTNEENYDALCYAMVSTSSRNSQSDIGESNKATMGRTKILLAVRWRKPLEERKFFERMESKGYKFDLIPFAGASDEECCDLDWKSFGNPDCEKSNAFFTNTYIQVDGISKPLKDVSEEDTEDMNNEEHAIFESKFMQIYIGTVS